MRGANKERIIRVVLAVVGALMAIGGFLTKTEEHGYSIGHTAGNLLFFGLILVAACVFGPMVVEDEEEIRHKALKRSREMDYYRPGR